MNQTLKAESVEQSRVALKIEQIERRVRECVLEPFQ